MNNINTIQSTYGSMPAYKPAAKNGQKTGTDKLPAKSADKFEISGSSEDYQQLHDLISKMSDTRIPVVQEIKARIKIADYPIENAFNSALRNMVNSHVI